MLSSESCGLVGGMTLKYKWMTIQVYFHQDLVKSLWAQRGKDVYLERNWQSTFRLKAKLFNFENFSDWLPQNIIKSKYLLVDFV